MSWLGIPQEVLDEEERTMGARLPSGDTCRHEVDGIPEACVRPPNHEGAHYRLPTMGEA